MSQVLAPPAPTSAALRGSPLVWLSAAVLVAAVPTALLAVVDPAQVTGASRWLKPLKFELSIALYALTLAWLVERLPRGRRLARLLGAVAAALLAVEMVIILGAAALGTTSHFNVSTPAHAAAWAVMGASIAGVWLLTAVIGVLLWRSPTGDRALDLSVRAALPIALAGMAVAFLMTSPTPDQVTDYRGIVGAHTVGAADGGPGLPLLGWSTAAGDLRVPHFVGMHALQALPLLALVTGLAASRWPTVGRTLTPQVRHRLVAVAATGWSAATALLTWQALAGQSVVAPSGPVLVAGTVAGAACLVAVAAVVVIGLRRAQRP